MLAHYCRTAIDFGKHGKHYVDPLDLKPYYIKLNEEYPDFMEKSDKESYESQGALGVLYRQARAQEIKAIQSFILHDYEKSIMLSYDLDGTQVEYATENKAIFKHLNSVYDRIVSKMEHRLKRLVISLGICSEAEIFASDLQFKVFQRLSTENKYKD